MIYAPIIIPTLCRYEHFVRLMESLKNNTWAQYTDVYVALDYPPSKEYEEGYYSICKYLESDFSCFANFYVIRRTYNVGSLANCESVINQILTKYDRFIRTDDDAEFSPNFLEYMNKCLEKYKDDWDVIAVTGYSYPINWKVSDGATVFKENFICPMWGTGFWRDKYKNVYDYINNSGGLAKDARKIIINGGLVRMTNVCRKEFAELCLSPDFKKTLAARVTDISIRMYLAIENKFVIMPTISKVRNWGFDGSGEYCGISKNNNEQVNAKNYHYQLQQIDEDEKFVLVKDDLYDNCVNRKRINGFDTLPIKQQFKMYIKLSLYYLLGVKMFKKGIILYRFLRRSYGKR